MKSGSDEIMKLHRETRGKHSKVSNYESVIPQVCNFPLRLLHQILISSRTLESSRSTKKESSNEDCIVVFYIFLSPDVLNSMRDRPQAQAPVTYTGSYLHKSFAESLRIHNGDIKAKRPYSSSIYRLRAPVQIAYQSLKVFNP